MDVSGEIEPQIEIRTRLTTTFGLHVAQQFAAFRQRWVGGMVPDDEEEGRARRSIRALTGAGCGGSGSQVPVGSGQTDLGGYEIP